MRVISLDYKDFSEEAFTQLKGALKAYDLYLGDFVEDYYGTNDPGTTYTLYIHHRKLTRDEIKDLFIQAVWWNFGIHAGFKNQFFVGSTPTAATIKMKGGDSNLVVLLN